MKDDRQYSDSARACLWSSAGIAVLMAVLMAFCSCGMVRYVPVETVRTDSVLTVVKTETIYKKDTVYIEIPRQTAERITTDTVSSLENDFAISDAWITSDGTLHHTLETKAQEIAKEIETPVERKDSISYRYRYRTAVETVEVEQELTWWQQTQIYGFWTLAAIIIVWLLWKKP